MIRILVVDDHTYIRGMIRALLEVAQGWQICGEAANGQTAIDPCALRKPNLVVLDVHMPVCDGLEAARVMLLQFPRMLVLILTTDGSAHFVLAAMACGGQGMLVKARAGDDHVRAVSALLRGERYFSNGRDFKKGRRRLALRQPREGQRDTLPVRVTRFAPGHNPSAPSTTYCV